MADNKELAALVAEVREIAETLADPMEGNRITRSAGRRLQQIAAVLTATPSAPEWFSGVSVTVRDGNWTGTFEEWRNRPRGLSMQATARIATPSAQAGEVVACRGPGICEACSRAAGCCFNGERCGRTSCPAPAPNAFPKPTPCPNTPQPQGDASSYDEWAKNPYTSVLMKSIEQDYVPRHGSPQVSGGGAMSTDEIIRQCKAVGINWIAAGDDPDDFPGSFDMVTMAEMRALFAALSTPQARPDGIGEGGRYWRERAEFWREQAVALGWREKRDAANGEPAPTVDEVPTIPANVLVSVDVSTCDDDAEHRIFARTTGEVIRYAVDGPLTDPVILCIEESRNYTPTVDGGAIDYTGIANRAQEITGRSVWPSTVKAILDCARPAQQTVDVNWLFGLVRDAESGLRKLGVRGDDYSLGHETRSVALRLEAGDFRRARRMLNGTHQKGATNGQE